MGRVPLDQAENVLAMLSIAVPLLPVSALGYYGVVPCRRGAGN